MGEFRTVFVAAEPRLAPRLLVGFPILVWIRQRLERNSREQMRLERFNRRGALHSSKGCVEGCKSAEMAAPEVASRVDTYRGGSPAQVFGSQRVELIEQVGCRESVISSVSRRRFAIKPLTINDLY